MREFEAKLKIAIDKMASLLETEATVSNAELIEICRKSGLDLIAQKQGTHLIHEVLETAINAQICKNYRLSKFDDKDTNLQILGELSDLLKKLPPQSWRGEDQIRMQQFSTPPTIAFLMAWVLNPQKDELILEPSAEPGRWQSGLKSPVAAYHLNELSETQAHFCSDCKASSSTSYDAEFLDDLLPEEIRSGRDFDESAVQAQMPEEPNRATRIFGFRHIASAFEQVEKWRKTGRACSAAEASDENQKRSEFYDRHIG